MHVFIAHAHADKYVAREIAAKLRAADLQVFLDEDSLNPGQEYDRRIRHEIERARVFVFLASEHSLTSGCYALSELAIAKRSFRNPTGRVLPVLLGKIEVASLDPYLTASVTVLSPRGNVAAEVTAEVGRMLAKRNRRSLISRAAGLGGLVLVSLTAAKTWTTWGHNEPIPAPTAGPSTPPEAPIAPVVTHQPFPDPTPTPPPPPPPPPVVAKCAALRVAKGPPQNYRGWPVHDRPEHVSLVCHVADNESVNVLCRQGLNAVCIEGPDSESASVCLGYIHTDAFVFGKILATQVDHLPKCRGACPPLDACRAN